MTVQPICLDCEWEGREHPCRLAGQLNVDLVAQAYVDCIAASDDTEEPLHWSWGCVDNLAKTAPDLCLDVILACLRRLTTPSQASYVAAGPLEDIIALHGDKMVARIEDLAQRSARFRYLLSGVWPQGRAETQVWQRILRARAPGPDMDRGSLPPGEP